VLSNGDITRLLDVSIQLELFLKKEDFSSPEALAKALNVSMGSKT
jgi:hypothetical protein